VFALRAVVQRVKNACVRISSDSRGKIGTGLLVFLGVEEEDSFKDVEYLADKIVNLRVFEDNNGKMNLTVKDIGGSLLVVSQFTLYGDCRKGRRPSFSQAASPEKANTLYEEFIKRARTHNISVETGVFQAHMEVELVNDGPVTMLLDSKKLF
jgi:D-tyrosyl-tRNA(Tyr) deacylase